MIQHVTWDAISRDEPFEQNKKKTQRLHKEVLLIIVSGDEVERDVNKQGILNPGGRFRHMSTSWFKQINEEAVVWMQDHSVDHSC